MNITYKGKLQKMIPSQEKNLAAQFSKLAKVLDGQGERKAHVVLTQSRGRYQAEITVNYLDHRLAAEHTHNEQYTAVHGALDRLETQVRKLRGKRMATPPVKIAVNEVEAAVAAPLPRPARVRRLKPSGKPMTDEEALLKLESGGTHVVYRDADSGGLSVLVRRADGDFDLIQA